MTDFPTHGVLSVSTGVLMGDIGGVYEVISHMIGRPAMTHELAHYGKRAADALILCHPELPRDVDGRGWEANRDAFIAKHGETFTLDPALKDVLADDKDPVSVLREMGFKGDVIAIQQ